MLRPMSISRSSHRPSAFAIATVAGFAALTLSACSSLDQPEVVSRDTVPESTDSDATDPGSLGEAGNRPTLSDHFHAAYSVAVCDEFREPFVDAGPDLHGIHTHGEGIIHIHPFDNSVTGRKATLDSFGEQVDAVFGETSITLPDGEVLDSSVTCGGEPTKLVVAVGDADDLDADPKIYESNFGAIRLGHDRMVISIALIPESESPPVPWSVDYLDRLTDVPSSGAS